LRCELGLFPGSEPPGGGLSNVGSEGDKSLRRLPIDDLEGQKGRIRQRPEELWTEPKFGLKRSLGQKNQDRNTLKPCMVWGRFDRLNRRWNGDKESAL